MGVKSEVGCKLAYFIKLLAEVIPKMRILSLSQIALGIGYFSLVILQFCIGKIRDEGSACLPGTLKII